MEEKSLDSMTYAAQVDNETLFAVSQEGVSVQATGLQLKAYAEGEEASGDVPEEAPKESTIGALPASPGLDDDSLFLVQQQGEAKKATGALLKTFIGGGTPIDPASPEAVYAATRPQDWLKMPIPLYNEIYMLLHIPDGESKNVSFYCTLQSRSMNYTVEVGSSVGGVFTPAGDPVQTGSGSRYTATLNADDFGDLTEDGHKQTIIKVSSVSPITGFSTDGPFGVVEMSCKLPYCSDLYFGDYRAFAKTLHYFAMYGPNALTNTSQKFYECTNLKAVLAFDMSKVTNASQMFYGCSSLLAAPALDFSGASVNASNLFSYCSAMEAAPSLKSGPNVNLGGAFKYCTSLKDISRLDLSGGGSDLYDMMYNCTALEDASGLVFGPNSTLNGMFHYCSSLTTADNIVLKENCNANNFVYSTALTSASFVVKPGVNLGWIQENTLEHFVLLPGSEDWEGSDFTIGKHLSREALVELFESLPETTGGCTITLNTNPGQSELTDDDKAIATDKGWTLSML